MLTSVFPSQRPKKNLKHLDDGEGRRQAERLQDEVRTAKTAVPDAVPIRPWAGSVPIRKNKIGHRRGHDSSSPKLFDATSVEWVEKHFFRPPVAPWAGASTRQLAGRAALILQAIFAQYDSDDDAKLSSPEIRQLAAHIASVNDDVLSTVVVEEHEPLLGRGRRPATAQGLRGRAGAVGGRQPSKAPRSQTFPGGTTLSLTRFLAFCSRKAIDNPRFMATLFTKNGFTLNMEPQTLVTPGGAVPMMTEAEKSLQATLYSKKKSRRQAALQQGAELCMLVAEEVPDECCDSSTLDAWLDIPLQARLAMEKSRARSSARPGTASRTSASRRRPASAVEPRSMTSTVTSRRPASATVRTSKLRPMSADTLRPSAVRRHSVTDISALDSGNATSRRRRPPRPSSALPRTTVESPRLDALTGSSRARPERRRPSSALAHGRERSHISAYGNTVDRPTTTTATHSRAVGDETPGRRRNRPQSAPRQMVRHSGTFSRR